MCQNTAIFAQTQTKTLMSASSGPWALSITQTFQIHLTTIPPYLSFLLRGRAGHPDPVE